MKKLLLLMLVTPFGFAEIKVIEQTQKIKVTCISGYVFIEKVNGGIVQFMEWDAKNRKSRPLKCSSYKK